MFPSLSSKTVAWSMFKWFELKKHEEKLYLAKEPMSISNFFMKQFGQRSETFHSLFN